MFYIEQDNKIVLFNDDRQKLENTLIFMPQYVGLEIQETEEGYTVYNYQLVTLEEAEEIKKQEEHARIMELKMTPLDFLKAIIKLGISYDTIKQLMEANPEVDMEMRYCQNVYRKHPMLEQFATQFGVTSEQLDNIFIQANKKGG